MRDDVVEELLVAVLQPHQVDVAVEVRLPPVEVLHDDERLLLLAEDRRRQQAVDAQQLALLQGERAALGAQRGSMGAER